MATFKASVKIKRLMSPLDVSNATRHGQRRGQIKHVDASRTPLNRHWAYSAGRLARTSSAPDLAPLIEARRSDRQAAVRKNTPTIATEVLMIATRDAFLDASGQIDTERAYLWGDQMLAEVEEKWPGMSVAARLDLDEQTPHFSVFLVPIHMKPANQKRSDVSEKAHAKRKPRADKPTVSHNGVFGGPEEFSEHQKWAQDVNAAFFAQFGLTLTPSTPKSESGAKYIPPHAWRELQRQLEALKDDATKEALAAAVETTKQITEDAVAAAAEIKAKAQADATQIKTDAEAERDAARDAARDARQAAENAAAEAKALLDAVKVAQPLKPLHDAYKSLLSGSSLTPRQALDAQEAANQDAKWLTRIIFTKSNDGFEKEDRDAAVWMAHPEVAAEIRAARPNPIVLDLLEPASAKIGFRGRFLGAFSYVRDLVMRAVETVIQRHAATIRQDARERMSDADFEQSAKLGGRLMDDTWGDLRAKVDMDTPGRTKSDKCKEDWREWERLKVRDAKPVATAREELYTEAEDHARAASVVASRIERGPKQVAQWLSIPRDLRATFTAALDAAAALETALARRNAPAAALEGTVEAQEPRPGGQTPGRPSSGL